MNYRKMVDIKYGVYHFLFSLDTCGVSYQLGKIYLKIIWYHEKLEITIKKGGILLIIEEGKVGFLKVEDVGYMFRKSKQSVGNTEKVN